MRIEVEPRGLSGELHSASRVSLRIASREPLSAPDDCGTEIFGVLFGVLLRPALELGRGRLCPKHGTPRVEAGSDETGTALVTPELDMCPKVTGEVTLRAGVWPSCCGFYSSTECKGGMGLLCGIRNGKDVSLTLRLVCGDPLLVESPILRFWWLRKALLSY